VDYIQKCVSIPCTTRQNSELKTKKIKIKVQGNCKKLYSIRVLLCEENTHSKESPWYELANLLSAIHSTKASLLANKPKF